MSYAMIALRGFSLVRDYVVVGSTAENRNLTGFATGTSQTAVMIGL